MTTERNITFPIYSANGQPFNNLVLHKATYDSVVMSLGDKITGDVYYKDNKLNCTMQEYVVLDGVKFTLVNPPTIVKEGMVSDNSELKGMTKYSFEFYHPMYMLTNLPFTDIAVDTNNNENRYKSQDKSFSWAGYFEDFVAKIEKNLQYTEWTCEISSEIINDENEAITKKFSEVLTFDNNTIGDALKTEFDTWGVPFVIDVLDPEDDRYGEKKYLIHFGNPTNEIYATPEDKESGNPFIFKYGQGVGLKNNSATPKNNKIITRLAGYGSERNIPYGYPQIVWTGSADATTSGSGYPIYEGIVGGEYVKLIKHPFTRKHLMPPCYIESVRQKVDDQYEHYNANTELVDYYDALDSSVFPNVINQLAPSYEIHAFDDIYPQLGEKTIVDAEPVDTNAISSNLTPIEEVTVTWDDSIDDEGNYKQSYFKITLPILDFDLYACAAITQEMQINMRSGACIGCTFNVQVDWEDYKLNFYTDDLKFAPNNNYQGCRRDFEKYPDSRTTQLELICEKDTNTFGTLMPNTYQYPVTGDKFVILGISLPASYISQAESDLQDAMQEYMLENNVYYFDYPLKFDEYFLANNTYILQQIKNNTTIRFEFGDVRIPLYVKQLTINFGSSPLPQYNITLTDDIDIVLNQIGQVTEDVSKMRVQVGALQTYLDRSVIGEINNKLSKVHDDTASGYIAFLQGLRSLGDVTFSQSLKSRDFSLGNQGASLYPDTNGEWHFETDHLTVRKKFSAKEVEILKVSHVGGSQVLSPGSMVISRVENYQNYYRCYFKNSDEDGTEVLNTFALYDQAYCQTFNLETDSEGNTGNHYWWRLVVGIGDDYIDVCNIYRYSDNVFRNTDGYDRWSSVPQVGDNVVTLGNRRDTTRRNAIVLAGAGDGNPYLRLYTGISGFSLVNKVTAQISPSGSWITVTDSQGQSWNVVDLIESISSRVDNIEEQSDQQMVLWFGDEIPTLLNEPASEWVATDTENNNTLVQESHVHDMYYNRNSSQNGGGKAYEFINDNGVFQWVEITNVDVISALETANNAQDTADGKRRVFVSVPQPPYDEGDLWVNAVFPTHVTNNGTTTYYPSNGQYTVDDVTYTEDSPLYDNDVLRCVTPKNNSGAFNINDWTPAQYYTKNRIESKITQTVDEIRLDVGNLNNDLDTITDAIFGVNGLNNIIFGQYGTGGLNGQVSSLSVTVDGISQLVYDEDTGYTLSVQTVEGLVNTVSDLSGNYTTLSQTVSGLSSRVSTVEGWDSRITQNANNIALSVTKNELETVGIHIDGENSTITLNAEHTIVSDDLIVKQVETKPITGSKAKIVVSGSLMGVYGDSGCKNIEFGVDDQGYATMKYFDNEGNLLYDLGPAGLRYLTAIEASCKSQRFYTTLKTNSTTGQTVSYYKFIAKRVQGIITADNQYANTLEKAQAADGKWFTSSTLFDSNGNLTNLANNSIGVRYAYDRIEDLKTNVIIPATTANECKTWVMNQYGLSNNDVSSINFAGTTDGDFWTLDNNVYVQKVRTFTIGVMNDKYIIWQ